METFVDMVNVIPEGSQGEARIEHFEVTAEDSKFTRLRAFCGHMDEYVEEGAYCRLYVGNTLMMSDTQMERRSNSHVVRHAKGDMLIAGLGVGLILVPILAKPEVETVTVVEKYRGVIDLVEPPLRAIPGADKLKVIEADIFEWSPPKGQKWSCIYFDIWPNICGDNLEEMAQLHRKFARRKAPGGWMDSWQRDLLKYHRDRDRRAGSGW